MRVMIELEEAQQTILERIQPVESERIPLENAFQRVLAEDIASRIDLPPFDRSPLDGYAYRASDAETFSLQLTVVDEIPAGTQPRRTINAGEAARIFTGAPIPAGANCVVRQEDTEKEGDQVKIIVPVKPGSNLIFRGEELKIGDMILQKGCLLTPPTVGLLASVGCESVQVYRRPRVALLTTGSELMDVGQPLLPAKIYNSNRYTMLALLQKAGCEVKVIPNSCDQVPDTLAVLAKTSDVDIVISTGGASVGEYDLMRQALAEFGCELLFWKLKLKPGTPAAVGQKGKQLFFSLSGNPAAALVTYELIVQPALRKLAGLSEVENQWFPVKMANGFSKGGKQRRFLRARAVLKDGEVWADLSSAQGSNVLRSMVGSQLLIDIPANHGPVNPRESLWATWIEEGEN